MLTISSTLSTRPRTPLEADWIQVLQSERVLAVFEHAPLVVWSNAPTVASECPLVVGRWGGRSSPFIQTCTDREASERSQLFRESKPDRTKKNIMKTEHL